MAPQNKAQERELAKIVKLAKRPLYWVFVFSFAANMLMLAMPIYTLQVLDRVIMSYNFNTLLMLTLVATGCLVFYAIFTAIRGVILARMSDWLQSLLSPRLMAVAIENSAIGIPASAGQFQRELHSLRNFISGQGITSLLDTPWSIIFIITIYLINPLLGLLSLVGAVLLLGFGVAVELSTKKPVDDANELANQNMLFADAASRNAEVIEAMGMLPTLTTLWKSHSDRAQVLTALAGDRSNLLVSLSRFVRMGLQIAVIGVGAWLALQNELTVGGMIGASILMGRALAPFEGAIGTWKQLILARDAYHRLDSALTDVPRLRGTMQMPAPGGTLQVEQLVYTPPRGSAPILKAVSFALNANESLGLIGPSAAGKSTLARLLMGILPPTHGSVRLDGVDIFHWNREDLGQYVGYLPQNVELFPGTIRENIARMEPDAKDEDIIAAAQFAGCHEMILRLPQGYETEFNALSVSLSPGQRQRVGLARALYKRPSFVVLDEPNANLDGEGETALRETIIRMKEASITFILVAHKPSIVTSVDKILMLKDGMIKDFGLRDEVLSKYTQAQPAPASSKKIKPAKPKAE
ncbi:MAG: type I secretion system permease/ATPase [Rickettsiales bacterium]|nr:type I secretion system permease/ATPase [Rickettsiales bacterium]